MVLVIFVSSITVSALCLFLIKSHNTFMTETLLYPLDRLEAKAQKSMDFCYWDHAFGKNYDSKE